MDFREADRHHAKLARQRDTGSISDEEFNSQLEQLMVQDDEGRWWAKVGDSGQWHYHDSDDWVQGTPPAYGGAEPATGSSAAQTPPSPSRHESSGDGRRKIPLWIPLVGLGGIALLALVVGVLVPYLRGEPMSVGQGGSAQEGVALEAAFVHRATPENIAANNTYLDNPLINDDPNAILYVTQHWNPGTEDGIYNNHPIGVWYDSGSQRWAIFNQDREAMPDGAAFNVAVLGDSAEAR